MPLKNYSTGVLAMKSIGQIQVGDIVVLSESYGGKLPGKFRGQVVAFLKDSDINGNPCVRVKRLDLASGSIQAWGQSWLEKVSNDAEKV